MTYKEVKAQFEALESNVEYVHTGSGSKDTGDGWYETFLTEVAVCDADVKDWNTDFLIEVGICIK